MKMKPCPFCGCEGKITHYDDDPTYLPCCSSCDGMIEKWFDTEEEAIEAWNSRATKQKEDEDGKAIN